MIEVYDEEYNKGANQIKKEMRRYEKTRVEK